MTARRRPPKTRGTTEPEDGRLATGVLLEEIRGQLKVVIAAVQDRPTRGELGDLLKVVTDAIQERPTRAELKVVTEELRGESRLVIDALRLTKGEIEGRLEGIGQELRGLRQDVARHAQVAELRALEQRVTVLERHVGG
jgi:hypothetical protein